MSYLLVVFMALSVMSCENSAQANFRKGECVQDPKTSTIWQIQKVGDDGLYGFPIHHPIMKQHGPFEMEGQWIRTECPTATTDQAEKSG